MTERKKLSAEEIAEILALVTGVYKEHGRTITTATLIDENNTATLLVDNRKEEDLN